MDLTAVMSSLKSMRSVEDSAAQEPADHTVHVVPDHLRKLQKQLGTDHQLSQELWLTGDPDARTLATLVADPDELTPPQATQWMKEITLARHECEVADVIARTPFGLSKMRQWRKQKSEYARATGYAILCCMLHDDPDAVEELECTRVLKDIESEILRSPGRAQHAMIQAVIAIGVCKQELRDEAMESGDRIGQNEFGEEDAALIPDISASILSSAVTE